MTGVGDAARGVEFKDYSKDTLFQKMPGQLSPAVDITSKKQFTNARVKIKFDPSKVPNADYQNLKIMYWDEGQRTFIPLDKSGVDVRNGYVWADTTHFTTFVLFYIPNWSAVWQKEMGSDSGRNEGDPNLKNIDVVLDLDSSGSMSWNDPYGYRKTAAKSFIDALIERDRVGIVDFDHYARLYQPLTTDYAAAKRAVDWIDSSGGTNIAAGVQISNTELINKGNPGHLKVTILLTDGEGYYDHNLTKQAKDAGITIYTIGLGSSVDENLLRSIAEGTGGAYYPVSSAKDLPQVFRKIAEGPGKDDGKDTDGDGISDYLERGGYRLGNGTFVKTNPNDEDTDGDGLTDGEEAGKLSSSIFGSYYPALTDPTKADTDGDTLGDFDELDMGLSPTRADTDTDSLDDATELNNDFDPFNTNPDGDHRDDAEELAKGSDPFYYDSTAEEYVKDFGIGLVAGDLGQNLANMGIISHDTISSFGYLSGWVVSGLVAAGDARDLGAALGRGDWLSAVLSLVGLLPYYGDALKTGKTVKTFLSWTPDLAVPVGRWAAVQLDGFPPLRSAALKAAGWSDEVIQYLPEDEVAQLARGGNDPGKILTLLRHATVSAKLSARVMDDPAKWARVEDRVHDAAKWKNLSSSTVKAEAYATEVAVELLKENGYRILYVNRNADEATRLVKGPDIVAETPTGQLSVIEAKGGVDKATANKRRLTSKVGNTPYTQPSFGWLQAGRGQRYLPAMEASTDPNVREAARRLANVIEKTENYEAIAIVSAPKTSWGKIDEGLKEIHGGLVEGSSGAQVLRVDQPLPKR